MPTPRTILINAELPEASVQAIKQAAPGAEIWTQDALKRQPELWRNAEVLFTHLASPEKLAEAKALRWIQTLGAGVEWLLKPELVARPDLIITNSSGVHAEQIGEHVFALILALTRRLPRVFALQRERRWDAAPFRENMPTLAGATLGVLGVGAIGEHTAKLGAAFGMRVLGMRRSAAPAPHVERMYAPAELHELLRQSQYIVNALPLTSETRGLIGPAEFAVMRRDAVIINIGRGGTLQTDALVSALRDSSIAGAGLDVTDPEPLPAQHALWEFENVIITPHYSGGRPDYLARVTEIFVDNLRRYAADQTLTNVVDVHAGY
jgi:D-2-hydroxyacid dehydrogenase (NADP+)